MSIRNIIKKPASFVRLIFHKSAWRKQNRHNDTEAINYFTRSNVKVGKHTYGPIEILYDTGAVKVTIGNYCSIAKAVKMFLGGVHDYQRISTFPFQTKIYHGIGGSSRNEVLDIVIEDDVWIGYDCIILPGAHIGKGSVIGARSVVTGNIPPYSIYVSNKVIKKRFSDEIIGLVSNIDFSQIEHRVGDAYEQYCTQRVNPKNINEIRKTFAE